ncbi:MAG: ankyrin repeat domain-containing protein, partial [Armatimonadota bacterium]
MSRKAVFTVIVIVAVITVGGLLKDWLFNGGNSKIYYLGIWKNTPAWNLALAVKHQNVRTIKKIVIARPELLNYQEPKFGATLLIWSVGMEKYKSAEALLKCGADPNIQTTHAGETALYVAAGYSWVDHWAKKDSKYVKLLLKYGADPNINYVGFKPTDGSINVTEPGASPLMNSIGCGIE